MHDGYIFTIGIAGSAGGAAAACLDLMLAALPPVKRAAYLGAVFTHDGLPSLSDPLTAPIWADIADAEVLLIATPLPGGRLPARLHALTLQHVFVPRPRFAALVTFGAGDAYALEQWLHAIPVTLCGQLHLPEQESLSTAHISAIRELARSAYYNARELLPHALQ
jgi:hypothetical protein